MRIGGKLIFPTKLRKIMENGNKKENIDVREQALELYCRGAELWRCGDRKGAIACYTESAALCPDGPGAVALEMTRDIMDFYDTQQYNP